MNRVIVILLVALVLLAGCQEKQGTVIQAANAVGLEILYGTPYDGIYRFEDRGAVCYVLIMGSNKGGISCLPLGSVQ